MLRTTLAGIFFGSIMIASAHADNAGLNIMLGEARRNCSGISKKINDMKTMAGINTAVTGVGALAGGGAIGTGLVKAAKDREIGNLQELLKHVDRLERENPNLTPTAEETARFNEAFKAYGENVGQVESDIDKLKRESKTLGNWRTGLLAGNTAANVAGAVIAGGNTADGDLTSAISACKKSVANLEKARVQAGFDSSTNPQALLAAQRIITACGRYNGEDLQSIDGRAKGAMFASIGGAVIGGVGTAASAGANSDQTRSGDKDAEKNLNTAANVMAVGATASSAVATIFNGAQIAAINKAAATAKNCEEALR